MKKIFKVLLSLTVLAAGLSLTACINRSALVRLYLDLPPYENKLQEETVSRLKMRDGVELETRLFLPEGKGPWPAILVRDPYSDGRQACEILARYDYACVHQDVRGRYSSDGEWYPIIHERNDGLDTLDWMIQQPWQDGNIATFGVSYLGLVQWAMIDQMPKEVKTVVADISHGDFYEILHHNGHLVQGVMLQWALDVHHSEATLEEMAAHHPLVESNALFLGEKQQWLDDYLTNTTKNGQYWNSPIYRDTRNAHKQASMPVLMLGAWHDFFLEKQFQVFEELPRRSESIFYIRNGSHGIGPDDSLREIAGSGIRLTLEWLDRYLRGQDVDSLPDSGYLLQSNVDGTKHHYATWPQYSGVKTFYLDNLALAADCDGGKLATTPAAGEESVSYQYDPSNPVPSRGGSFYFGAGVVDQKSDLCARTDVLSFESGVFESDAYDAGFTILGSINIALEVSSDANDSAFTVKLQEKLADGRVLNIRDDITSLSYRKGALPPREYEAGTTVEVVFDLTPIQWVVQPGSSLRLDISSSNYPIFNAHSNTTEAASISISHRVATQTIIAGKLIIPVR